MSYALEEAFMTTYLLYGVRHLFLLVIILYLTSDLAPWWWAFKALYINLKNGFLITGMGKDQRKVPSGLGKGERLIDWVSL